AINEGQRRLAALGLFRRARISELRHGGETTRDLLVTIEEAPPTTVGYGGGVEGRPRVVGAREAGSVATERLEVAPRAFFEIDRTFPDYLLSGFSGTIIRDTRDDQVEPTAGRFVSANAQLFGRAIGGQVGFAKSFLTAQTFHVLPHTSRMVFAGNARLGLAAGFPRPAVDNKGNP